VYWPFKYIFVLRVCIRSSVFNSSHRQPSAEDDPLLTGLVTGTKHAPPPCPLKGRLCRISSRAAAVFVCDGQLDARGGGGAGRRAIDCLHAQQSLGANAERGEALDTRPHARLAVAQKTVVKTQTNVTYFANNTPVTLLYRWR